MLLLCVVYRSISIRKMNPQLEDEILSSTIIQIQLKRRKPLFNISSFRYIISIISNWLIFETFLKLLRCIALLHTSSFSEFLINLARLFCDRQFMDKFCSFTKFILLFFFFNLQSLLSRLESKWYDLAIKFLERKKTTTK